MAITRNNVSNSRLDESHDLPSWIFDIDDDDSETSMDTPLLQELEIDLNHIYRNIEWMIVGPLRYLVRRPPSRHPLYRIANTKTENAIDFWGPCSIFSLFGAILWAGHVKEVPWVYVIWSFGATFNHLVCRVWLPSSKLLLHMALLGYSATPLVPFALIISIWRPPVWISYILEMMAIVWAASAAVLSYNIVFSGPSEKKSRLLLLLPSVILMELYLISLLPIKR